MVYVQACILNSHINCANRVIISIYKVISINAFDVCFCEFIAQLLYYKKSPCKHWWLHGLIEEVSNARAMTEKLKLKFEACKQITQLLTMS